VDLTRSDGAVPAKKTKPNLLKKAWLKAAAFLAAAFSQHSRVAWGGVGQHYSMAF